MAERREQRRLRVPRVDGPRRHLDRDGAGAPEPGQVGHAAGTGADLPLKREALEVDTRHLPLALA